MLRALFVPLLLLLCVDGFSQSKFLDSIARAQYVQRFLDYFLFGRCFANGHLLLSSKALALRVKKLHLVPTFGTTLD